MNRYPAVLGRYCRFHRQGAEGLRRRSLAPGRSGYTGPWYPKGVCKSSTGLPCPDAFARRTCASTFLDAPRAHLESELYCGDLLFMSRAAPPVRLSRLCAYVTRSPDKYVCLKPDPALSPPFFFAPNTGDRLTFSTLFHARYVFSPALVNLTIALCRGCARQHQKITARLQLTGFPIFSLLPAGMGEPMAGRLEEEAREARAEIRRRVALDEIDRAKDRQARKRKREREKRKKKHCSGKSFTCLADECGC